MKNRIHFSTSLKSQVYENCELESPFSAQWNSLNHLTWSYLWDFLSAPFSQWQFSSWLHSGHQKTAEGEMEMASFILCVLIQAEEQQKAGSAGHEDKFKVTLPHTVWSSLNSAMTTGNTGTWSQSWGCLTRHRPAWPPSLFNICGVDFALVPFLWIMKQGHCWESQTLERLVLQTLLLTKREVNAWEQLIWCWAVPRSTVSCVPAWHYQSRRHGLSAVKAHLTGTV